MDNTAPRPLTVALAGLAALAVAMGIGRFAFTPILPMMQDDLGLTVAQGGWLASANYAGYLAGALSALWLRAEAVSMIRGSLVLTAAVTAAMGLADHFALWLVLRAAAGVGSAWVLVFVSAWCLDRLAAQGRPGLGSILFTGVGAGMALAGLVCVALMRAGAASAQAWFVLGGLALVLTIATWPVFRKGNPARGPAANKAAPTGRFRWDRDAVLIVVCYGVFGFGYIIPATFVPAMAKQIVSDPAVFGWSWPLFGAAAVLSTLGAGGLVGTLGNRGVWVVSALVMAVGVAAPAVSTGMAAIMVSAVCVGATFVVVTLVGMQEARRVGGAHAKTLMAAMTASFAAGQIAGPLAVSALAVAGGSVNVVLLISAALLVASAAAVAWSMIVKRQSVETVPE